GRGFGLAGVVAPDAGSWRLPAWVALSGALHWEPTLQLLPARLGASGRLATATVDESFTLGAHGPLRAHDGAWTLLPAHLVLRGDGMVPRLHARGHAALGARLLLRLDGRLARWPDAWPALPPPLDDPGVPLALGLDYRGARDLSSPLALRAARGGRGRALPRPARRARAAGLERAARFAAAAFAAAAAAGPARGGGGRGLGRPAARSGDRVRGRTMSHAATFATRLLQWF